MPVDTTATLLSLLLLSVGAVVVLRRLNLPAILGYLAVGMLAGPHALGLVKDIHDIHLIAEFGVVFLLFMLGLEFSLPRLIAMRRSVVGMGGAQVILTALVTGGAALMMGFSPAAAFVLAGVLSVSSTAIVIRQQDYAPLRHTFHGDRAHDANDFAPLAPRTLKNVSLVPGSAAIGQRLAAALTNRDLVVVDAINRHGIRGESPSDEVELQEGDVLTLYGSPEALDTAELLLLTGQPD